MGTERIWTVNVSLDSTYEIRLARYKSISHKLKRERSELLWGNVNEAGINKVARNRANDEVASRLLVSCHEVIDGISRQVIDLWISRQTGPLKWHNQLWKKENFQKVYYEVFDLASLGCHVTLVRNWVELHFGTVLGDKVILSPCRKAVLSSTHLRSIMATEILTSVSAKFCPIQFLYQTDEEID